MKREFSVKLVVLVAGLAFIAAMCGCTSYYSGKGVLRSFRMVKPLPNTEPEYADKDVRVGFRIIDDKRLELSIKNLTRKDARIFWKNSSFAAIDDDDTGMGVNLVDADGLKAPDVSVIGPRDTLAVEVYPMYNAVVNDDGMPDNRPLYVNASGEGTPDDLVGKQIGVNLVLELNGGSRYHRFRIEVTPSPPEPK